MDGTALADKIRRGMGCAARRIGSPYVVLRPRTSSNPLSTRNRIIKLYAAFNSQDGRFDRVKAYGDPVWWGVFDASYTQPGDYLVGAATYFVAAQLPLLPVQCVLTNRTVTVARPMVTQQGGYSGLVTETAQDVLAGWPASILALSARISGNLPETRFGNWTVLLPALPFGVQVADVVTDDIGRVFVVAAAEQSDLGWRLTAREVAG
jgi:hypothetical protein